MSRAAKSPRKEPHDWRESVIRADDLGEVAAIAPFPPARCLGSAVNIYSGSGLNNFSVF